MSGSRGVARGIQPSGIPRAGGRAGSINCPWSQHFSVADAALAPSGETFLLCVLRGDRCLRKS